ncbi:carbohydrate ABC transporter permease, partial [Staphylococcus sp. SIMBA_130]
MAIRSFTRPILYVLLIALSCFYLMPVYVMIITSLKPLEEVTFSQMWQLPTSFDFSSYFEAFTTLAPNLLNSFYLVI